MRTWTLILLLLDTGLRIDEALSLNRSNVDLHNCMIRVRGKRRYNLRREERSHMRRMMLTIAVLCALTLTGAAQQPSA
ncbi:MAG TPA: tyrosine-type recombinase/integrase, partial [Vicinamibacterales bacterium]|nr:tyrosine-type recombinase/integrase [Vicinamibacterales bacterium]